MILYQFIYIRIKIFFIMNNKIKRELKGIHICGCHGDILHRYLPIIYNINRGNGIYPWDNVLVRRSLDGEAFWVGCGWFFLGGRGRGKGNSRSRTTESFSQDDTRFRTSLFYVIYYIFTVGFRFSMCQTIANGAQRSSMPWAVCAVQVGTSRQPRAHTEDSEGTVAPRSTTDSTE